MNPGKNILFIAIALSALTSCGKKSTPTPSKNKKTVIYVVGNVRTHMGASAAVYWKDGVKVALTDTTSLGLNSAANAVAVNDTDVYIAGVVNFVATYWKNGKAVSLPGVKGSYATAIAVSGTDVYVAGYDVNTAPTYWKNGVAVTLNNGGTQGSADAIAISGNNVYVAGNTNPPSNILFWNNGVVKTIANSPSTASNYYYNLNTSGWVNMAVSGPDVYITGATSSPFIAKYWKNGNVVPLVTDPNVYFSAANNIVINGPDIYIAGEVNSGAAYWKNGTLNSLSTGPVPILASASGIAVNGNDIYVSGNMGPTVPLTTAVYWKDNSFISLEKGPSFTIGIAVVLL